MSWVRGLLIVFGAPVVGCFTATLALQLLNSFPLSTWDMRAIVGFSTMTLIFAIPGSMLLSLLFGYSAGRDLSVVLRLAGVILVGIIAGAAMLGLFSMAVIPVGALYGGATAVAWVLLAILLDANIREELSTKA